MNDENLSLNENQGEDSTQGENDESQGTTENQEQDNTQNQDEETQGNNTQDNQEQQDKIRERIATLKKALEYLESQNEQGLNQEIEIAKLQEILQEIEQLRKEVFTDAQEKLEESEAYFSLVGVKVALLEKLKAQNEC